MVREHGAGEGALALALLAALPPSIGYAPLEVDERRLATLRDRLATADLADRLVEATEPFEGVVIGNEVLDALPVHRVRQVGRALRELAVDLGKDGEFVEVEVEPTSPALAGRLTDEGIELVDGQTAEICLALDAWMASAAADLERGLVVLIDYGYPAADLYDPVRRRDGTLRAYVRHQVGDDPYRMVGRQDLTAHVDVTAVQAAAEAAGLTTLGVTTQAEALMGLGIENRLRAIQVDPATTIEGYTLLRAALLRLLDPAAMGRFRVMVFGRDWPATATVSLLGYRLPGRPSRAPD